MKKYIVVIVLFLVASCIYNQKDQSNRIYLSGSLINQNLNRIEIVSGHDTLSVPVDSNGKFDLAFTAGKAQYHTLFPGKIQLFLSPGDSLHININQENNEATVSFSGRGEKINHFLNKNEDTKEAILEENRYQNQIINSVNIWEIIEKSEADEFISQLHITGKKLLEPLNRFNEENLDIQPQFMDYETKRINYFIAEIFERLRYFTRHRYALTDEFYNKIGEYDLNDESLLQLEEYITFLDNYTLSKGIEIVEKNPAFKRIDNALTRGRFEFAKNHIKNTDVRNYLMYEMIRIQLIDMVQKILKILLGNSGIHVRINT